MPAGKKGKSEKTCPFGKMVTKLGKIWVAWGQELIRLIDNALYFSFFFIALLTSATNQHIRKSYLARAENRQKKQAQATPPKIPDV